MIDRRVLVAGAAGVSVLVVGIGAVFLARRVRKVASGGAVVLLGDSIGVGISGPLAQALAAKSITLVSDAHLGWNARQVASSLLGSDLAGQAFVVSLGSNDAALADPTIEADAVNAIVAAAFARGASRVLWIVPPNFSVASPPAPATTAKQQAFAALWSDRRIEKIAAPPDMLGPDGIHLPPTGYADLAARVAAALV